jgi:hypothetical protein
MGHLYRALLFMLLWDVLSDIIVYLKENKYET